MIGSVDDMKRDAYDELKQTLEEEELEVCEVMGELYVSNPRHLGLAGLPDRLRAVEEDLRIVEAGVAASEKKIAATEEKIAELNDQVSILKLAGPDYKRVRNPFLSVFKRDIMKETLKQSDRNFIAEGNVIAHSGDAAIDALLYDGEGRRQDWYVFEELYGLHPSDVRKITHGETIEVLNRHARVKANDPPEAEEFYRRFAVFLAAFKREDPVSNYLLYDHTNPTRAAYWCLLELQI
ncbi:unnamed protein product [Tuber aestivum]|uniref:Uncharacterized protein n=1 Tax=Tuber aestivum TaxID=59557 RepID=A0A292PLD6_9PEZI|nr:unnamed protein product [Tuber aestivum]